MPAPYEWGINPTYFGPNLANEQRGSFYLIYDLLRFRIPANSPQAQIGTSFMTQLEPRSAGTMDTAAPTVAEQDYWQARYAGILSKFNRYNKLKK